MFCLLYIYFTQVSLCFIQVHVPHVPQVSRQLPLIYTALNYILLFNLTQSVSEFGRFFVLTLSLQDAIKNWCSCLNSPLQTLQVNKKKLNNKIQDKDPRNQPSMSCIIFSMVKIAPNFQALLFTLYYQDILPFIIRICRRFIYQ